MPLSARHIRKKYAYDNILRRKNMSKTVELARHLEKLHINNMYKTDFYWT